jgi:ribonuclease D
MPTACRRLIIESRRLSRTEHEMNLGTVTAAASTTSWPEAAIAIAGIALVTSVSVVVVWQALATWRTRIAVTREEAYRKLAEQTARELHEIHEHVLDVALKLGAADRKEAER